MWLQLQPILNVERHASAIEIKFAWPYEKCYSSVIADNLCTSVHYQSQFALKVPPHERSSKSISPVVVDGDGVLQVPHLMVPSAGSAREPN